MLTIIDIRAKHFWIEQMPRKTSENINKALVYYKTQKGDFEHIRADAGAQFLTEELKACCVKYSVKIYNSPPEGQNINYFIEIFIYQCKL